MEITSKLVNFFLYYNFQCSFLILLPLVRSFIGTSTQTLVIIYAIREELILSLITLSFILCDISD